MVEFLGLDAGGDLILVEHHVVGEALVVDERDGLAGGDTDLGGEELQRAVVAAHLHGGRIGGRHEEQRGRARDERLPDGLQGTAAGRGAHGRHAHHGGGGHLHGGHGLGVGL